MSLMKKLLEQFDEEIEGVEEYSKCAIENKDDPELFKMYSDMAVAELGHAKTLHQQIAKRTAEPIEPEDAVKALEEMWKDKNAEMVCKMATAKGYLDTVK